MTIVELISQGAARLKTTSDSPILDAEVLLAFALDLDRTRLLQSASVRVTDDITKFYFRLITIRRRGLPVAYLTGRQAFMDLIVDVTPHTLIPRPFTETLVERVLLHLADEPHVIADIGTGSGAIALAIAKHAPRARVIATDVSLPALRVAGANARQHHLLRRIELRAGSLLEPLRLEDSVAVVVGNLPYLPATDLAEPSIRHEPTLALHGGRDGLALMAELIRQLRFFPTVSCVALELLPEQADTVAYFLRQQQFIIEPINDGQRIRGLIGTK